MSAERKRHVIPGEIITSGSFRAEQNTIQVGDNIVSTIVGLSDVHDGSVRESHLPVVMFQKTMT